MNDSIEHPFKVLIFGYINLNVVDGSAFFIAAMAKMLSQRAGVQVDVLSANRIRSHLVTQEIEAVRNIELIDVFDPSSSAFSFQTENDHTLTRAEAAQAVMKLYSEREYDAVIIRDMEVAADIGRRIGPGSDKLFAYVTGVSHLDRPIDTELINQIQWLLDTNARFLVQTSTMQRKIENEIEGFSKAISFVLGPFVPNSTSENVNSSAIQGPLRLIYAGKFYSDWIPDKIIAAFGFARERAGDMMLTVAGNAFKDTIGETRFVRDTKHLLANTPGVEWLGGIPRDKVRRLLEDSDVGISWRSSRLDSSTEFSTKVLEYGAAGVPSIVNRSPVNESFLGDDYPLYADGIESFISLLVELADDRTKIDEAREIVFKLASEYSYGSVSTKLLSFIDPVQREAIRANEGNSPDRIVISDSATDAEEVSLRGVDARSFARLVWRSGYAFLYVDQNSTHTVEDLILEILFVNRLRSQLALSRNAGEPADHQVDVESHGSGEPVSAANATVPEGVSESGPIGNTSELSVERISELEQNIEQLNDDLVEARSRLESLRASKLGRLQRWWWRRK
ncbi:hypothetical protein QFE97_02905 [Bacillus subtilis]|nr:hypothetical protein QFE97_02905 [Bacillus subtilis]